MNISQNTKMFREMLGLSQQELAKKIGVSQQMIFSIEQGCRIPSVALLIAMADVLETTPNDILGYVRKEEIK